MFGDWVKNIDTISEKFSSASPFPHVVIKNFFSDQCARDIASEFGTPGEKNWHQYKNPLERKFAKNINLGERTTGGFDILQSPQFVKMMSKPLLRSHPQRQLRHLLLRALQHHL
jgi:hypothetical protein